MQKIKVEFLYENTVARVILDDGKANILDGIMMSEITEFLVSLKNQKDIKLVTFEGGGNNFSYGASVAEHMKDKAAEMLEGFHKMFFTLLDLHIPTLAKLSGQCLGGGFELPLVCNFIFADKSARIGQPEIILGVFAPPASVMLPLKVGNMKAEELLITGKIISAEEAKSIGLINEVFEDKVVMDAATDEWIRKNILGKSASSLRFATKAARASFDFFMLKFLPLFSDIYVKEMMETHDANEGINAFIEKRKPVWKNQ
ncbi:MAG: enoyl-CoA hydratase-related protein [Bacteroidales bacterium]|jgi:cyclohexa-1,5-dienecarbonyl-CoA hydratase|nr:enoyl-CoA hydratase-related protein [Bacteroidales bacterium]